MSTEQTQRVMDAIAEISGFERSTFERDTELVADLGIDSPKAIHLLLELESRFAIEISDEEAGKFATVGDVLDAIARLT